MAFSAHCMASACWPRIAYSRPRSSPPQPEAGIELHGLAGVIDRFIHQSDSWKEIRPHGAPHLAERVLFDHARQLKPGLVGTAGREEKECAVPLTQVRRERLAPDGEPEAALGLAPVVVVMTGDDAEHGVGFGQVRVDFERALRELARPRHRLTRRRGADRREGEVVIGKSYVRQRKLRVESRAPAPGTRGCAARPPE